jgi:DNA-binding protein HU-beta
MNRVELIEKLSTTHDLSKAEAKRVLATITDTIVASVKKGQPVSLVGFGTFKLVARAARSGFNPRAGEKIKIPAAKVPKFVPGAGFKDAVDPAGAKRKAAKKAAAPAKVVKKTQAVKATQAAKTARNVKSAARKAA